MPATGPATGPKPPGADAGDGADAAGAVLAAGEPHRVALRLGPTSVVGAVGYTRGGARAARPSLPVGRRPHPLVRPRLGRRQQLRATADENGELS